MGPTPVEAITQADKRANLPISDAQEFVAPEIDQPVVRYPRDSTLDPQMVWRGKDALDGEDLVADALAIYIQEKIDPRVIVENLRRTAAAPEDEPGLIRSTPSALSTATTGWRSCISSSPLGRGSRHTLRRNLDGYTITRNPGAKGKDLMGIYNPRRELATFAAGGSWPDRFMLTTEGVVLEIPRVPSLDPVFARHAAGLDCDVRTYWSMCSVVGYPDSLVAFNIRFDPPLTDLRILFWARQSREVLDSLLDSDWLVLMSRDAVDAALARQPHPDSVRVPITGDKTPVLDFLAAQPSFAQREGGWDVMVPDLR